MDELERIQRKLNETNRLLEERSDKLREAKHTLYKIHRNTKHMGGSFIKGYVLHLEIEHQTLKLQYEEAQENIQDITKKLRWYEEVTKNILPYLPKEETTV